MAPKVQGESKRGLVVTLVFFILATIGLGLSTYYGFAEQEKKDEAVKTAKENQEKADKERDAYRIIAYTLTAYLDKAPEAKTPTGDEFTPQKFAEFVGGTYPEKQIPKTKTVEADVPPFRALIKALQTEVSPWRPGEKAPDKNYKTIVAALVAENKDLQQKLNKQTEQTKIEEQKRLAAEAARNKDSTAFAAALERNKNEFKKDREDFDKQIKNYQDLLSKAENTKDEKFIQPLVAQLEKATKDLGVVRKELAEANSKLTALQAKVDVRTADKPSEFKPRGKISRVHVNPRKATIDLGKRDGLTPQTTFAVHGLQTNGKPKVRAKGNIEVLTVGETSSEVLVTAIFHPDSDLDDVRTGDRKRIDVLSKDNVDPIIAGDVLINPLWNPGVKTHIAIAGNLELLGGGAISMTTLIRLLEQMNVVVDAYIDPADGVVRGRGMTRRTDYILLGSKPSGKEVGGAAKELGDKINEEMNKLLNEARANGIRVMQAKRFFEETGFNLPRNIVSE